MATKEGSIIHGHVQFFVQVTESFKLGQNISADFLIFFQCSVGEKNVSLVSVFTAISARMGFTAETERAISNSA
jgi:hypothetical protein